ncbi:C40 family peptidase [Curvibacter sp. CHRR-16]|uniref:C40 family peptidase n=1 Tax=Curvibacter sp. CHRR-16 TaxID=2835872 RepID=UPI001BD9819D|nr:C40 family peptidase [Curvibacter sp. CHRR-16]MBT0569233.1 C40 family peptidase [Curvibacter sp. CHRR-16]
MRTWIISLLLLAAGTLHAQEAATNNDQMHDLLIERGLITRITDMGQKLEAKATELVLNSMAFLGVPYRRGGNNADTGFDCSGFVRAIYEQTAGLLLPRQAAEQAKATAKIEKTELKPGDLVFFNTMRRAFSHVGIYIGNGKFIHSPRTGAEVRVEDMDASYWRQRFDGARRVLTPDNKDSSSR